MALTNTLENLDKAHINFFKGQTSHPVFKRKGIRDSYTTNCIRSTYKNRNYSNIEINIVNKTIKFKKIQKI